MKARHFPAAMFPGLTFLCVATFGLVPAASADDGDPCTPDGKPGTNAYLLYHYQDGITQLNVTNIENGWSFLSTEDAESTINPAGERWTVHCDEEHGVEDIPPLLSGPSTGDPTHVDVTLKLFEGTAQDNVQNGGECGKDPDFRSGGCAYGVNGNWVVEVYSLNSTNTGFVFDWIADNHGGDAQAALGQMLAHEAGHFYSLDDTSRGECGLNNIMTGNVSAYYTPQGLRKPDEKECGAAQKYALTDTNVELWTALTTRPPGIVYDPNDFDEIDTCIHTVVGVCSYAEVEDCFPSGPNDPDCPVPDSDFLIAGPPNLKWLKLDEAECEELEGRYSEEQVCGFGGHSQLVDGPEVFSQTMVGRQIWGAASDSDGIHSAWAYLDGELAEIEELTLGLSSNFCTSCEPDSGFSFVLPETVPEGNYDLTVVVLDDDPVWRSIGWHEREIYVPAGSVNARPENIQADVYGAQWIVDGYREYPLWLEASDADGIRELQAHVNFHGSNNSNPRGRYSWKKNVAKWGNDVHECDAEGGFISKAGTSTGSQHVTLTSCASATIDGNKVAVMMVRPEPGFEQWVGPNGSGQSDASMRAFDVTALNSAWTNFDQNFLAWGVGNTDTTSPVHHIAPVGTVGGLTVFSGWSVDYSGVETVEYRIDSGAWKDGVWRWVKRQDVCDAHASTNDPHCPFVGHSIAIDLTGMSVGSHTVQLRSTDSRGNVTTTSRNFTIDALLETGPGECQEATLDGFFEHVVTTTNCQ